MTARDPAPAIVLKPSWVFVHELANDALSKSVGINLCTRHGLCACPFCAANTKVSA